MKTEPVIKSPKKFSKFLKNATFEELVDYLCLINIELENKKSQLGRRRKPNKRGF